MNKLIPQWGNKMTEDEAWDELERKQAKRWNTTDMAHRPNGLSVEQAEKQEPVDIHCPSCLHSFAVVPVAKREFVGLTDEEIAQTVGSPIDEVYLSDFRNVEAKLKERNNG